MYLKIAICCVMLQMPTLGVIVGQLRFNPEPHYRLVEWMLQNSANTNDAGPAYFPLISDIKLMEYMAGNFFFRK